MVAEHLRDLYQEALRAHEQFVNDSRRLDDAIRAGKLSEWVREQIEPAGESPGKPDQEVGTIEIR